MTVITYASIKGGVGKTSNAILTATNLANRKVKDNEGNERNIKVLFIDFDAQNSATVYFTQGIEGIENTIEKCNVYEMLGHNNIVDYAIHTRIDNIDIVPSHLNINKLRSVGFNELKKTLKNTPQDMYDYLIIDTAPYYDNIVINAILASDFIFTPVELNSFGISTTKYLQKLLYDDCIDKVGSWYLFTTKWDESKVMYENSIQMQFMRVLEAEFTDNLLDIHIPKTDFIRAYVDSGETARLKKENTASSIDNLKNQGEQGNKRVRLTGSQKVALEFNRLMNMIMGYKTDDTSKYAEKF